MLINEQELIQADPHQVFNIKGKDRSIQLNNHKKKRLQAGPSCSKLTTSLVNDSLKFVSSDTQIF